MHIMKIKDVIVLFGTKERTNERTKEYSDHEILFTVKEESKRKIHVL